MNLWFSRDPRRELPRHVEIWPYDTCERYPLVFTSGDKTIEVPGYLLAPPNGIPQSMGIEFAPPYYSFRYETRVYRADAAFASNVLDSARERKPEIWTSAHPVFTGKMLVFAELGTTECDASFKAIRRRVSLIEYRKPVPIQLPAQSAPIHVSIERAIDDALSKFRADEKAGNT